MTQNGYNQTVSMWRRILFRLRTDSPLLFLCRFGHSFIFRCETIRRSFFAGFYKLIKKDRFIVREVLGSKMYLDLEDRGLAREILVHGTHESLSTSVMQKELAPGQVILDVGANIGYYAMLEAKTVGDKGHVYCMEPAPGNIDLLRRNVKVNGYKNIEIFHAAAGAKTEMGTIYLSESHNQHALIAENVSGLVGSMPVQVFALDDFLEGKPYPSLIRMDVEGFELDIMRGLKKTLAKNKPLKVFVEIHGFFLQEKVRDLLAIFKENGFRIKVCIGEPPLIGGGRLMRALFDYCSKKIGRGNVGFSYPTIEELEDTLTKHKELGAMALFERL